MAGRARLKSLSDLRRHLASLINQAEAGELDMASLSKLSYSINVLSGLIQVSDIETRLEQLEKQIEDKK
ncbi:MAG: hypothetical protein C4B58_05270 [Deltaproteobacteria bacterium]|nr:MAG: hypothetical protein C4B58_05270 [Deltaproteobacteria bacterium]